MMLTLDCSPFRTFSVTALKKVSLGHLFVVCTSIDVEKRSDKGQNGQHFKKNSKFVEYLKLHFRPHLPQTAVRELVTFRQLPDHEVVDVTALRRAISSGSGRDGRCGSRAQRITMKTTTLE